MHLCESHCRLLLDVARQTIGHALGDRLSPLQPDAAPALLQPAGCFVSLHERRTHRLRGCIGRLDASRSLLSAVQEMARAVLEDPRFVNDRVRLEDLPDLELEITVLSPLHDAQHVLDFDPCNEGIYLTVAPWTGCFLPQVARETGWTRQQLLSRLCSEKMGLSPDAWQDPRATLQTFTALILGPAPFGYPLGDV
jgi:uncharacterized protein